MLNNLLVKLANVICTSVDNLCSLYLLSAHYINHSLWQSENWVKSVKYINF